MNALYHRGMISPIPTMQTDPYQMESYGFRVIEQQENIVTLRRDPVPLTLSGLSWLTWNLDHYPATHAGTRQLEHDLIQWNVSAHDRLVLLLMHQERYGPVVGYLIGACDAPTTT